MDQQLQCPQCRTALVVPAAAGSLIECPVCRCPIQLYVPQPVPVPVVAQVMPVPQAIPTAEIEPERRPCRMCGEMIVVDAGKCRFCGEIYDASALPFGGGYRPGPVTIRGRYGVPLRQSTVGTVSMFLGIGVALSFCVLTFVVAGGATLHPSAGLSIFSLLLLGSNALGLVLGIVGVADGTAKKGPAIIGLVINGLMGLLFLFSLLAAAGRPADSYQPQPQYRHWR